MIRRRSNDIILRNDDIVEIKFRNFDGHPDRFNPNGCLGNFVVVLAPEAAKDIEARFADREEFAIKVKHRLNNNDEDEASIKVSLRWDKFPPSIKMFTYGDNDPMIMNGDTIGALNNADIVAATLKVGPSRNNGCYLREGNFVIDNVSLDSIDRDLRGLNDNG